MPRLLLVDDEPRIARALAFALANTDFEIVALSDPGEIESQAVRPDVILLDLGLREADGLDVCRRLKASERFKDIPVLIMSGQTDADTKAAGFDAGADDFIVKPFVPTELIARVRAQLARPR